jgi:hypothetical protein
MTKNEVTDREQRLVEIVEHLCRTLDSCADVPGSGLLMLRRSRDAGEELRQMGFEYSELAEAIVASLGGPESCNCEVCRHARN